MQTERLARTGVSDRRVQYHIRLPCLLLGTRCRSTHMHVFSMTQRRRLYYRC